MKVREEPERTFAPFVCWQLTVRNGKRKWSKVTINVEEDLRVSKDLQRALRKSMTTLGWYMQLKEFAHARMKRAMFRVHSAEEEIYDDLRREHAKLSETQVKNKVRLQPRWRKLTERYMHERDRYRFLSDIVVALKERNENLRTLESSERAERQGKY